LIKLVRKLIRKINKFRNSKQKTKSLKILSLMEELIQYLKKMILSI